MMENKGLQTPDLWPNCPLLTGPASTSTVVLMLNVGAGNNSKGIESPSMDNFRDDPVSF